MREEGMNMNASMGNGMKVICKPFQLTTIEELKSAIFAIISTDLFGLLIEALQRKINSCDINADPVVTYLSAFGYWISHYILIVVVLFVVVVGFLVHFCCVLVE